LDLLTTLTQLVTTLNYSVTADFHTYHITTAHSKPFKSAFTTRFPVTDLTMESRQPQLPSLILTDSFTTDYCDYLQLICPVIISRQGPHRKHRSFLYSFFSMGTYWFAKALAIKRILGVLRICYLPEDVTSLFVSRSLPINGTIYLSMALQPLWTSAVFQFLNLYTLGTTQGRYLHSEKHKQNKRRHACFEWRSYTRPQCQN
jgi:hypothetical protein